VPSSKSRGAEEEDTRGSPLERLLGEEACWEEETREAGLCLEEFPTLGTQLYPQYFCSVLTPKEPSSRLSFALLGQVTEAEKGRE
jgi:hypothetical protein